MSRTIYSSKTVKHMFDDDIKMIQDAGIPLDIYTKGYVNLGAKNSGAISKFADIARIIYEKELPIPPSPFAEYIVGRTCGKSKQDFSGTVDGNKGDGKSYSTFGLGCRYGYLAAEQLGGHPTDYFSLDNCALLEDTEAISQLLLKSKRFQFIIIDDASVALNARDYNSEQSKNFNKVLTTCRTRRWAVFLNVPVASHIDKHIRELVDCKINVYRAFHDWGFNILKISSSSVKFRMNKLWPSEKHYVFDGRKFGMWALYTPDVFEEYAGQIEEYDKQRDEATSRILSQTAEDEIQLADSRNKSEKEFEKLYQSAVPKFQKVIQEDKGKMNIRKLCREIGQSDFKIYKILARMREEGKLPEVKKEDGDAPNNG